MNPIATVRGTCRSVVPLHKRANPATGEPGEVFGSRLTILTEPGGGFLDVTAFNSVLSPVEAAALEGASVEVIVSLGARTWKPQDGGARAQLDVVLQAVVAVPAASSV